MQRRKPFEAQINQKEISIEKKVITKKIQNTYSEQKSPILSSYPPIPKTTAINLMGGQKFKETTKISNFKNYEIKDIPQERKHRNHKVYLSSRYNNMRQEETPNLLEQVSMNEEINDFNLQSIKGKKSPVQNGETLFSKELKNPNIKFNINPPFEQEINSNNMKINTNESIKINSSAINNRFGVKYMVIPQTKLSPIQKIEEGSSSFDNKKNSDKKNIKTNILNSNGNNNQNINIESIYLNTSNINNNLRKGSNPEDHRNTQGRIITDINSPSYNNERVITQNSNSNTVSKKELKRIVKKFNKVYDPYRNSKGILLKQSQITLPGASDEIFSNRYRVLSKMNKLSNILLAKQKNEEGNNLSRENSPEINNIFQRNRSRSKGSKSKIIENGSNKKINRDSNIKEVPILRRNRIQKGGVVDLAQEEIKKNKFKIIKASAPNGGKTYMKMNVKYREKAAKIIQGWWRELKDIYDYKIAQIIKIQSIWKGRWVRKNIYDLLYLNYLYLSFCEKIEKIFTNKITKYALDKLVRYYKYNLSNNKEDALKGLLFTIDKKRINLLKEKWDIWVNYLNNEKQKKNKGKVLFKIRADKDNKLNKLRNAFKIWKIYTKMDKIKNKFKFRNKTDINDSDSEIREEINMNGKKIIKITKIEEKERYITPMEQSDFIGKNKFKGLLKILEGANNFKKKQDFEVTAPKIKKYLNQIAKIEKLKYLLKRKDKIINDLLKVTLNKWRNKILLLRNQKEELNNSRQKNEYEILRTQIFLNRIDNLKNKRKKIILRKFFYQFIKSTIFPEKNKKYSDKYYYDNNNYNVNTKEEENNLIYKKFGKNSYPFMRKKANEKVNKIKYVNIIDTLEGCKKLEKYTWRSTHKDILDNFKEKIKGRIRINYMIKIVKLYEKNFEKNIKKYFDIWKNNTFKRINNDIITRMFVKIIKIIIDNNTKKILSKRLNQWHNKVKLLKGKNSVYLKSKNTYDFIEHLKKYINRKYLSDLLNKLKGLRKEKMIYEALFKIIIRNEIKNVKNLIKCAFNKWKRIIPDSKIENLKGKLLIKIYDKYNVNKNKDALKKYLTRWENNTIFIDKITTIISEETTTIYNTKNKKDKIIIILKSIIRNLNRKNNENSLRKYFNIWNKKTKNKKIGLYNNINKSLDAMKKINAKINAKYFIDELQSRNKRLTLKKIISKYGKPKKIILNYYFSLWSYKSQKISQIQYSRIIQEFTRQKLKERNIINKWIKLYYLLKNKLNLENKLYLLEEVIYYKKILKLIKSLKGNNRGNIYDKYFLKDFIKRMKNINENNYKRNQIMNRILNRAYNKTKNNLIKDAINKWRKKISDSKIENLKGKLLLKIYDKFKNNKIKEALKKYLSKWENNTIFIDKITTIISEETTTIYNTKNKKDKIIIILKSIIRNLNRKNNEIYLRKYFNIWKKNIRDNNIYSIKYFEKVISKIFNYNKNNRGKDFINKLRNIRKEKIIKNVFIKYGKPKNDIIDYFFQRWKYINKKMTQIENDKIIQQFCRKHLRNLIYIKKWKKLFYFMRKELDKNEIYEIILYLKYYKGLSNIFSILSNHNKRNIFDKIKQRKNYGQIYNKLFKIIEILEQKNSDDLLRKYFDKWINYVNKENKRLNSLFNMLEILEMKNYKNSANYLSDAFIIKKLMKDIDRIRALNFLQKIKNKGKKNDLYKNLTNNLINAKNDIMTQNRQLITEKIIKIYFYKIISNLFDKLNRIVNINSKEYIEEFFYKLIHLNLSKAEYKYIKISEFNREPNIHQGIHIIKKSRIIPKTKKDNKSNKVIIYRNITPLFVKYLNKILKKRNYEIFDKLKKANLGDKFTKLLKSFEIHTNIPDKEDLVDSLKYYVYMKLSKLSDSNKLYYLIRKSVIRKILTISESIGYLSRLYHLVNITLTHRNIAKDRWILKIIKRWRFVTFVKKMAQKKMELMYKDLHVTYLEMADSVLKSNPSLEARFLPDVNFDENLFNFNDPYLIKGSNAYKGIKKQYVFEPLEAEKEKIIKEIKTIEKYKEINKSYYSNKDYSYSYKKGENKVFNDENDGRDNNEEFEDEGNSEKNEIKDNNYNNIRYDFENESNKSSGKKHNFTRYPGSSSYFKGSDFKDMNEEL